jgi:hypothetical protein
VSDGALALENDGVDRPQRRRLARELVDVCDRQLLARMGDVDAAQAVLSRLGEQVANRLRREIEVVEVDELVLAVHAQGLRLVLVERGAQRGADAGADESQTERGVRAHCSD